MSKFMIDNLVKSQKTPLCVIPAEAGIQKNSSTCGLPLPDRSRGQASREWRPWKLFTRPSWL